MKVTIKGLTASVITLNSIGIIIRGDCKDEKNISGSVARHITVDERQLGELEGLRRAGLISIEVEEPAQAEVVKTSAPCVAPAVGLPDSKRNKASEKSVEKVSKGVRKIKKISKSIDDISDSEVTVVTPGGVTKTQMFNRPVEMQESEMTRASLEAMEKLEKEAKEREASEDRVIDEKLLDPVDRMGEEATIVIGDKAIQKVAMKNSILPHADAIKQSEKFIDKDDKEAGDSASDAFIES